jgi:hypothetical protein
MSVAQEALKQGDFLGAETIDVLPDWFKTTFMDFSEDLEEAHAKGRHVMIYFHQNGCPQPSRRCLPMPTSWSLTDSAFLRSAIIKERV